MAGPGLRRLLAALLLAGAALALAGTGPASAAASPTRPGAAVLVVVDGASFEELTALPPFRRLWRAGGAALMATDQSYRSRPRDAYLALGAGAAPGTATPSLLARVLIARGVTPCRWAPATKPAGGADLASLLSGTPIVSCTGIGPGGSELIVAGGEATLADAAAALREVLGALGSGRTMVIVFSPNPSARMNAIGDEVTPLVLAEGRADRLLARASGPTPSLTSDTTRRDGLVANVDVAPTVLTFFGIPVPAEMDGRPIRGAGSVDLYALHRLHLEQRRIRLPVQLGEVSFTALLLVLAVPALLAAGRGALSARLVAVMRWLVLCGAGLSVVLLAGGLLPRLTYAVVVPYLLLATAALGSLAMAWGGRGPMAPFVLVGAVGLSLVLVDALFGGRAFATPLLGGTAFDGVRFYGLPNAFIATVLASALFVAAALPAAPGFLVLVAAGLVAGLPPLGANVGAAATLFAAAGMWAAIRTGRPGREARGWVRAVTVTAVVAAVGTAAILAANRYLPGAPTHATLFVRRAQAGGGSVLSKLGHRLDVGWHMLNSSPAPYVPLVGLVVALAMAVRSRGIIGRGLRIVPVWRDALIVMVLASAVAYVTADTGIAAAGPALVYAATALVYPALLPEARTARPAADGAGQALHQEAPR